MSSNFDPSKLGDGIGRPSKSPRAERLFVEVENYLIPEDGEGHEYVVGHKLDKPGERVRVRLNTVKERAADRPSESVEKITGQYATGEFVRESIASKKKEGVKLLSFDDARKIGVDENGVGEYRAHWSKTMSTSPDAEYMVGQAHIRLKDAPPDKGKNSNQAYVEMMRWSTPVSKDNIDEALTKAFAIKDDAGRARDPLVVLRVSYEGDAKGNAKVFGSKETVRKFNAVLDEYKEVPRAVDADKTIDAIMSGKPGYNEKINFELDKARAIISAVKGLPEPKFNSSQEIADKARNFYHGIASGALQVELIASEKIDFGPDSRKTYLDDKKKRPHLAVYDGVEEKTVAPDKIQRTHFSGYANTVVAFQRHPDGEPYAVFASPVQMYPTVKKMNDLPLQPAPLPEFAVEKVVKNDGVEQNGRSEPEVVVADEDSDDLTP